MDNTGQLILFDYSQLAPDVTEFIQRRTLEIRAFHKRTAESIIQIGLRLSEIKNSLGHGHFMNWLDAEFGWSYPTAVNYMHVADKFINFIDLDHYDTSAMYLLAAPSTPNAVLDQAQALTIEGEYISHARAEQLIREHKQAQGTEQETFPDETEKTDDLPEEQEIANEPTRYTCSECGEVLGLPAWHCLSCHCHWPTNISKCPSCGMPYLTGAQVDVARLLRDEAPDLFEQVKAGDLSIPSAKRELTRRQKRDAPPLPDDKYRVWYADPPWRYNDSGVINDDNYGRAERHYPTMSIPELCAMGDAIKASCLPDAVLFLWTTSPLLEDAFKVIDAWGFEYKTSFVWDKVRHNFGHYNSVRHEFLLICTRGSCTPDNLQLFDSVQEIERTDKHSEKPEEFRQIIETLYTTGSRIELFAREDHDGWDTWGNEPDR